ncbi:MAG: protein kinase, partial [Planctomycetaceae bacterium]
MNKKKQDSDPTQDRADETVLQPADHGKPEADETVVQPTPSGNSAEAGETVIGSVPSGETVISAEDEDPDATGEFIVDAQDSVDPAATQTIVGSSDEVDGSQTRTFVQGSQIREAAKREPTATGGVVGGQIGDYRIDSELGRGGMGVVYKAHHTKLRRDVALKMILTGKHSGQQALERFLIEARAVAHLQHPNIVQIFDIGEHEGLPYFSLEFVKGAPLDAQIKGEPQTPQFSAEMTQTLAHAMQFAHDNGVLHRDIKPANVLVAEDGTPKVADFGLAKHVEDSDSGSTQAGTIMGSPSYMSPEQAGGRTHEIGPASDQYSLGALLYEMLTGRPPFKAPKPLQTVMQVINQEPVPPRQLQDEIPLDLETICLKALQKDQSKRYESCEALADDLRRYINGEPIEARPVSNAERFWRWCKRNPTIAVPSALALLGVCITAFVSTAAYFKVSEQADSLEKQAVVIKEERDNAKRQEGIATAASELAARREKDARAQADLALGSVQSVFTEVNTRLGSTPQFADVRKSLMLGLVDNFDKLEIGLTENGVEGEGIPTLMAIKMSLAVTLHEQGESKKSNEIVDKLILMARERLEIKGRNDASRTNLARVLLQKASIVTTLARDSNETMALREEARQLVEEAIQNPVREEDGGVTEVEVVSLLGAINQAIAVDYLTNGNMPKAATYFEAALDANGKVLEITRSEPGYDELSDSAKDQKTYGLQMSYDQSALGFAYILLRLGKTEKAIPRYQAAVESRQEIANRYPLDKNPALVSLHQMVAGFSGNFGNSLLWLGRVEEAEPLLVRSLELSKATHALTKDSSESTTALGRAYYRLGTLRDIQQNAVEAKANFEASRDVRQGLADKTGSQKDRIALLLALARCGDMEEALVLAREFGESEKRDGEMHLERARAYAQLSRHADSDEEREELISLSIKALSRATTEGYSDPFRVGAEHDLAPIREDTRYQAILTELQTA